jgi:hypothetical protein
MILHVFLFANHALYVSQHTLKHSNFFLILQNKLSCVLEQEKALKVEEFFELVKRMFWKNVKEDLTKWEGDWFFFI